MVVRGRWTLVVSLLLLQSFTLGAGLYVWTTGFSLDDAASQAAPEPTPTRTPVPLITAEAVLASGSEGTAVDAQRLAARLKGPIADAALGGR
ncbi:MAG: D-alanyl-D-alanine carboxypeptidase/D-alanyl-D-alanine-endopeptidase, partial [Actinomycetes bacterium]